MSIENMKISVVLTTYNGEKYLPEQINSILNQTLKPDQLLILDDCSTDGSVRLCETFTRPARDIGIKIVKNAENKGWRANFMQGFGMAEGDLIFCADQDDIWDEHKIEKMAKVMLENKQINALCCNLTPLYHEGATKLAGYAVSNYGENRLEKVSLEKSGFKVLRPGCTMCFRSSMLGAVEKVWAAPLAHDEVIWAVALVTDSLYILNEPLIQFRRHGGNNSPSNEKKLAARLDRARCAKIKMENLLSLSDELNMPKSARDVCARTLKTASQRVKAFENKSILSALKILPSIRRKAALKSWIADVYTILKS